MNAEQLQQAVYDRLTGVPDVADAVVGIYTVVPQDPHSESDASFPFITISNVAMSPNDTKDDNGLNALFDVHIWSRSQSALSWRSIGSKVYRALHRHDLAITGANTVTCNFDSSTDFDDPVDGKTWHYVLTFRVIYFLT